MSDDGKASFALIPESLAEYDSAGDSFQPVAHEDVPAAVEALLFASGDPLTLEQLHRILMVDREVLRRILNDLKDRYARDRNRGVLLREADGSFVLATKPGQFDILARLFSPRHRPPLTPAAYETLAVIAYNQPVTRAQIEAVRGVNSDNVIGRLVERNLIHDVGSLEAPGRPTLFATTDQFLLDFGLRNVADLPPMEMLMYGTLRDIEQSLESAANQRRDNQVTIDQIVAAIVPNRTEQTEGEEPFVSLGLSHEPVESGEALMSRDEVSENAFSSSLGFESGEEAVVGLSAAFFGSDDLELQE